VSQCQADIAEVRRNLQCLEKAADSNINDSEDRVAEVIGPVIVVVKKTLEELTAKQAALEEIYKKCSDFYCEDNKRQPSEEVGKKIMGCLYFICKTE